MGFRLDDVITDSVKYIICSNYIGNFYEDDNGFPDYQRMIKSGEYDYVDMAQFYLFEYLKIDIRDEVISIPEEDINTVSVLCNILETIFGDEYKHNKWLLPYAMLVTDGALHLPGILFANRFYFELIVFTIMSNEIIDSKIWIPYDNAKFSIRFTELLSNLSNEEIKFVLELLNMRNMAKEAAMLFDACKNCGSGVTDFDL